MDHSTNSSTPDPSMAPITAGNQISECPSRNGVTNSTSTTTTTRSPTVTSTAPNYDILLQFDPLAPSAPPDIQFTQSTAGLASHNDFNQRSTAVHDLSLINSNVVRLNNYPDALTLIYNAETDPESSDDEIHNNYTTPDENAESPAQPGSDVGEDGATVDDEEDIDHECVICMNSMLEGGTPIKTLPTCCHTFHTECLDQWFSQSGPKCPSCLQFYGVPRGNQPDGRMTTKIIKARVPGHEEDSDGAIEITYNFRDGIQDNTHPHPGRRFTGARRVAYLPNNPAGQRAANLLRLAFECGLVFTIGDSVTTGVRDIVIFNGVHHKTVLKGSPYGYPDKGYLDRLEQELAVLGITDDLTLARIHESRREARIHAS